MISKTKMEQIENSVDIAVLESWAQNAINLDAGRKRGFVMGSIGLKACPLWIPLRTGPAAIPNGVYSTLLNGGSCKNDNG